MFRLFLSLCCVLAPSAAFAQTPGATPSATSGEQTEQGPEAAAEVEQDSNQTAEASNDTTSSASASPTTLESSDALEMEVLRLATLHGVTDLSMTLELAGDAVEISIGSGGISERYILPAEDFLAWLSEEFSDRANEPLLSTWDGTLSRVSRRQRLLAWGPGRERSPEGAERLDAPRRQ